MAGDGPRISTDEVQRVTGAHQFWAIRGHAIQSYANLEQALCDLFSSLAGMDRETGSIIFFRVTNAQARNSILEKLITKRFADEYNSFRNSLLRQLRPIDIERNEIVHWNALDVVVINETGKTNAYPALVPPSPWPFRANAPRKSAPDLVVFMKKCEFYIRLVRAFNFYI